MRLRLLYVLSLAFFMKVSTDEIVNLNSILDNFSDCFLHIINYVGVDFNGTRGWPVVLSRYVYFNSTNANIKNYTVIAHAKAYEKTINNTEIPYILKEIPHKCNCDAHFYVFPPPQGLPYNDEKLRLHPAYWNNLIVYGRYDTQSSSHSRNTYHVLVKVQNFSHTMWSFTMSFVMKYYPITNLCIFEAISRNNEKILWVVTTSLVGLKGAHFKTGRVFVPVDLKKFNLTVVDELGSRHIAEYPPSVWNIEIEPDPKLSGMRSSASELNEALKKSISFRNFPKVQSSTLISSDHVLFQMVVFNLTFVSESVSICPTYYKEQVECECDKNINLPIIKFKAHDHIVFVRDFDFFSFVACGSLETPGISLAGFVIAFDMWTWILIIVTFMGLSTLSRIHEEVISVQSVLIAAVASISVLLEQGDLKLQNLVRKRTSILPFAYVVLLAAVVLSNAYKGRNISSLTASLPAKPVENFDQLISAGYKVYSRMDDTMKDVLSSFGPSIFNSSSNLQIYTEANTLNEWIDYITKLKNVEKLIPKINLHKDEALSMQMGLSNFTFVNELALCNNIGVTGWDSELTKILRITQKNNRNLLDLGRRNVGISPGKEKIFQRIVGWQVQQWVDASIFRKMEQLVASGLSQKWNEVEQESLSVRTSEPAFENQNVSQSEDDANIAKRDDYNDATGIQLSGNMVAVFVVYFCGLLISTCAFIGESTKFRSETKLLINCPH